MARLGVVIGVSENTAPFQSLSACANDGAAISAILKQTGRFDDVLTLFQKGETLSTVVKDRLTAFVEKYKSGQVEELFFYFSGHGEFAGNEFYHILSDYDASARNRTSLASSELDAMVRGLAPELFVKIVDACHSGTSYIKSNEGLSEFLKGAKTGFRDVYFLYSSQSDQVSWTAGSLSAFTKCILQEVGRRDSGVTRYRDLMSAASDYFEASGDQTPQFVTQADFTQIFCDSSPSMQATVYKFVPKPIVVVAPTPSSSSGRKNSSMLDRIRKSEEQYCSREEAVSILENLLAAFADNALAGELADVFEWNVSSSTEKLPDVVAIGDWLSKNADRSFFAIPDYKLVTYKKRVPKYTNSLFPDLGNVSRFLSGLPLSEEDTTLIDATRREISDYSNTASLPYQKITLRLEPKFKMLTPLECHIAPILSATHLRLFWTLQQFIHTDWDTVVPSTSSLKWESEEVSLKNVSAIKPLSQRVASAFLTSADKMLASRWPEPSASDTPGTTSGKT